VLHAFHGFKDSGGPLPGAAGKLIQVGNTYYGVANGEFVPGDWGSVFSLTPPPTLGGVWQTQTIYDFKTRTKGANPASLLSDGKGGFYGVAFTGGIGTCSAYPGAPPGCGTVFHLTPPTGGQTSWDLTVIHAFKGGVEGAQPVGLNAGPHGSLYGVTERQGDATADCFGTGSGCGTAFRLNPPAVSGKPGIFRVIYSFKGGSDGGAPRDSLALHDDNSLLGAASLGGDHGFGSIFLLNKPATLGGTWTETTLYSFTGAKGGAYPHAAPALLGRHLVGTTYGGGSAGLGVVYELTLTSPFHNNDPYTETVVHNFTGGRDGAFPNAAVNVLYSGLVATTAYGGSATCAVTNAPTRGCGTVMEFVKTGGTWTPRLLHMFEGKSDGGVVAGDLTALRNGDLLGGAQYGGNAAFCTTNPLPGCGTLFQITP
jgi:hypothetical protein